MGGCPDVNTCFKVERGGVGAYTGTPQIARNAKNGEWAFMQAWVLARKNTAHTVRPECTRGPIALSLVGVYMYFIDPIHSCKTQMLASLRTITMFSLSLILWYHVQEAEKKVSFDA